MNINFNDTNISVNEYSTDDTDLLNSKMDEDDELNIVTYHRTK